MTLVSRISDMVVTKGNCRTCGFVVVLLTPMSCTPDIAVTYTLEQIGFGTDAERDIRVNYY